MAVRVEDLRFFSVEGPPVEYLSEADVGEEPMTLVRMIPGVPDSVAWIPSRSIRPLTFEDRKLYYLYLQVRANQVVASGQKLSPEGNRSSGLSEVP